MGYQFILLEAVSCCVLVAHFKRFIAGTWLMQRLDTNVGHVRAADAVQLPRGLVKHQRLVPAWLLNQRPWPDYGVAKARVAEARLALVLEIHSLLQLPAHLLRRRAGDVIGGPREQEEVRLLPGRERLDPVQLHLEPGRGPRAPLGLKLEAHVVHIRGVQGAVLRVARPEGVEGEPHGVVPQAGGEPQRVLGPRLGREGAGVDIAVAKHPDQEPVGATKDLLAGDVGAHLSIPGARVDGTSEPQVVVLGGHHAGLVLPAVKDAPRGRVARHADVLEGPRLAARCLAKVRDRHLCPARLALPPADRAPVVLVLHRLHDIADADVLHAREVRGDGRAGRRAVYDLVCSLHSLVDCTHFAHIALDNLDRLWKLHVLFARQHLHSVSPEQELPQHNAPNPAGSTNDKNSCVRGLRGFKRIIVVIKVQTAHK
mmetsp:Transcript_21671/g.51818  ORF Transcript_21671/g.51818 Transcript_21671/m.51818 type:complete len:427 (-) Transcript_21671:597-1877(-)